MDASRLHLMLNYYPSIVMVIGMLILIAGYWFKNHRAKKISMKLFVAIALLTFVVFVSGEIAGSIAGTYSGATAEALNKHKGLARPAFLLIEATGIAAFTAFVLMRRRSERERLAVLGVMVLAAATIIVVLPATYFGRQVKWAGSPTITEGNLKMQR